jgi:hypothetical protein
MTHASMLKTLLVSLCLMMSETLAENYTPLDLEQLLGRKQQTSLPEYIRVQGWYQSDGETTALVRGSLEKGGYKLRVEGTVFDWHPQAGALVDLWGRLERRGGAFLLRFHNGRNLGEARAPNPTPALEKGDHVQLKLNVTSGGSTPFPLMQGTTEDGYTVFLPRYSGPLGVRCLEGTVRYLRAASGERSILQNPRLCKPAS